MESSLIKKIGLKIQEIKEDEREKFFNLEFIFNSFKETSGVLLWEKENKSYFVYFLNGKPIFKVFYEDSRKITQDDGEKLFLNEKDGIISFYKINSKAIISILSIHFGEILYKDLDSKIVDFSQFLDSLGGKNITGLLVIKNEKIEFLVIYDGKILDIKDGEIFMESPLSTESESASLLSFAKLLMAKDTSITLYSIDKNKEFNEISLNILKYDINKLKELIKEVLRKILKEKIRKLEDMVDSIKTKEDIEEFIKKSDDFISSLYNKKISEECKNRILELI
ncbi:MAG: hypothetical protein N3D74_05905 [Caldisericia bacterium]|nr:hypothetical protein [Caldisericia bacterium]